MIQPKEPKLLPQLFPRYPEVLQHIFAHQLAMTRLEHTLSLGGRTNSVTELYGDHWFTPRGVLTMQSFPEIGDKLSIAEAIQLRRELGSWRSSTGAEAILPDIARLSRVEGQKVETNGLCWVTYDYPPLDSQTGEMLVDPSIIWMTYRLKIHAPNGEEGKVLLLDGDRGLSPEEQAGLNGALYKVAIKEWKVETRYVGKSGRERE